MQPTAPLCFTGRSKGWGIVEFESPEEVRDICARDESAQSRPRAAWSWSLSPHRRLS